MWNRDGGGLHRVLPRSARLYVAHVWLIWGSIINDKADNWKDTSEKSQATDGALHSILKELGLSSS